MASLRLIKPFTLIVHDFPMSGGLFDQLATSKLVSKEVLQTVSLLQWSNTTRIHNIPNTFRYPSRTYTLRGVEKALTTITYR